jgi:hypothetical protein
MMPQRSSSLVCGAEGLGASMDIPVDYDSSSSDVDYHPSVYREHDHHHRAFSQSASSSHQYLYAAGRKVDTDSDCDDEEEDEEGELKIIDYSSQAHGVVAHEDESTVEDEHTFHVRPDGRVDSKQASATLQHDLEYHIDKISLGYKQREAANVDAYHRVITSPISPAVNANDESSDCTEVSNANGSMQRTGGSVDSGISSTSGVSNEDDSKPIGVSRRSLCNVEEEEATSSGSDNSNQSCGGGQLVKKRATLGNVYTSVHETKSKGDFELVNDYFLSKFHRSTAESSQSLTATMSYDDGFFTVTPILVDLVCDAFTEFSEPVIESRRKAMQLIRQGATEFDGRDADLKEVWAGLLMGIPQFVKQIIAFCKRIPGVSQVAPKDFAALVNASVFDIYLVYRAPVFIDGQHYSWLSNGIQYTRAWMTKIIGEEMTNAIFAYEQELNELELTQRETALLIPYLLTSKYFVLVHLSSSILAMLRLSTMSHSRIFFKN